ncbi:MAG: hypothetical protein OEY86_14970 [Nitrospira sp.]|nr:hypothetical protein [Nitrospira sp.]
MLRAVSLRASPICFQDFYRIASADSISSFSDRPLFNDHCLGSNVIPESCDDRLKPPRQEPTTVTPAKTADLAYQNGLPRLRLLKKTANDE